MPLTVIFVRHGESQANVDGIFANRPDYPAPLTPAGIVQARTLAHVLASERVTHLYTSPLFRAVETAEVLASKLDVEIEIRDALREYDVGEFEGLPYADEHAWRWDAYERVDRSWQRGDRQACLPGGESLADIDARFLPFMESLAARHAASDRLVIVSHGGLYRVALPGLCRTLTAHDTRRLPMDHCTSIIVVHEDGDWRCLTWDGKHPPFACP
ncbi:MAG TPA: histidine phosphatase family protein [Thermomicrobiales bacterium]|nr:histidine phosphatase family protein [Thermomicrobiales bacterium]